MASGSQSNDSELNIPDMSAQAPAVESDDLLIRGEGLVLEGEKGRAKVDLPVCPIIQPHLAPVPDKDDAPLDGYNSEDDINAEFRTVIRTNGPNRSGIYRRDVYMSGGLGADESLVGVNNVPEASMEQPHVTISRPMESVKQQQKKKTIASAARSTNTGRIPAKNISLPLRHKKSVLNSVVRNPDLSKAQLVMSKTLLRQFTYKYMDHGKVFQRQYEDEGPKGLMRVTSSNLQSEGSNNGDRLAVEVVEGKNVIGRLDFSNDTAIFSVDIFPEVWTVEATDYRPATKAKAGWEFQLAVTTPSEARMSRNLWNHLCKSLKMINECRVPLVNLPRESNVSQLHYNLRPTTLAQRQAFNASSGNAWTFHLPGMKVDWTFVKFCLRHRQKIEDLYSGFEELENDDNVVNHGEGSGGGGEDDEGDAAEMSISKSARKKAPARKIGRRQNRRKKK